MRRKLSLVRLCVLVVVGSLLLLVMRRTLRESATVMETLLDADPWAPPPPPARKPLTKWNLTCSAHQNPVKEENFTLEPPLEEAIPCNERSRLDRYERRGDFWVLYNYVPAAEQVRCWETVTFSTHGELGYLDNLGPLVRRWRAPVSLALYAPGDDLYRTLWGIRWARACMEPPLVERFVSFHVLFDADHVPANLPAAADALSFGQAPNCSDDLSYWITFDRDIMYRRRNQLQYPANVARNVAREAAQTHFVLVSDLDMYPSPGLAPAFLEMVRRDPELRQPGRRVFVVPPFSVQEEASLPQDKSALLQMLREGSAVPFQEGTCASCYRTPSPQAWVCAPVRSNGSLGLHVVTRRVGWYSRWEPAYVGTHDEPLFDERLTWDGRRDKRIQGYAMCLMDYKFHVLDNAFLVHRPGIEVQKNESWRQTFIDKADSLLESKIVPEYTKLYGKRKECEV